MRTDLVPAPAALKLILEGASPSAREMVDLHHGDQRVLALDLIALRTQPPFNASAMDGYGVRQSDLASIPVSLDIVGQSAAGHSFNGNVEDGQAVRIFTGAPVPDDVDTIVIQENTNADGSSVEILAGNKLGKFIRKAGLDFREGDVLLESGRLMDPQSISLAASMNYAEICVWQKPVVAIIATGDELVLPGNDLEEGQIIASNSFALAALARKSGAEVLDMGVAKDTVEALLQVTRDAIAQGADLIITMGGASVGDHDLVLPSMEKQGFKFVFSKIAMRPGKPFLFATREVEGKTVRLLGLAGNPVSSIVAGQVFVRPLINALAGLPPQFAEPVSAKLGAAMDANDERQEYVRAKLERDPHGNMVVLPFSSQDSSMLANLVRADCLLIREINAPAAHIGDDCEIVKLR